MIDFCDESAAVAAAAAAGRCCSCKSREPSWLLPLSKTIAVLLSLLSASVELRRCKMDGKSVDNVNIAISEPLCCYGTQLRPRESVGNSGSPCDGLGVSDDDRFVTKCCQQCEQMVWKQRLEIVSFRFGFLNVGEGIDWLKGVISV